MVITILSLAIGMLGLIVTLVGTYLAYISFVNPIKRFKKYLKNSNDWEKLPTSEYYLTIFRHKKHPEYQIICDCDKPVVKNFQEDWIFDYPDREHNVSYFVQSKVNNVLLMEELFVSLDGGRIFVPVPRRKLKKGSFHYWYDPIQVELARIVGEYSHERSDIKNIEEFVDQQKIKIKIKIKCC